MVVVQQEKAVQQEASGKGPSASELQIVAVAAAVGTPALGAVARVAKSLHHSFLVLHAGQQDGRGPLGSTACVKESVLCQCDAFQGSVASGTSLAFQNAQRG